MLRAFVHWKVKAVQCYLCLLVWLVVVSIGLYWFLNRDSNGTFSATKAGYGYQEDGRRKSDAEDGYSAKSTTRGDVPTSTEAKVDKVKVTTGEIDRLCNPVQSIHTQDEYIETFDHKLETVIIILRHGERGPLTHIGRRNISHINCESKSPDFFALNKFASETLTKLPGYSSFIGPFHTFPKIPSSPFCSLGQLSQQGSAQLLALGKQIRSRYKKTLPNMSVEKAQQSIKVMGYSTRYRRTFQSLFAFLYGLLGPQQIIQGATILESQSISFCFKHCSCKAMDRLKKAAYKTFKLDVDTKAQMLQLVTQLNLVLGTEKSKKMGNSLLDSLLVYPCHNLQLPCYLEAQQDTKVQLLLRTIKKLSFSGGGSSSNSTSSSRCITLDHMKSLIKLINHESKGLKEVLASKRYHMLSSYGLLREIVNLALTVRFGFATSSFQQVWRKPHFPANSGSSYSRKLLTTDNDNGMNGKFVVFAGHDTTLQSITAALGIRSGHPDLHLPPFGSRLIFEFYRRKSATANTPRKLYFRIIYNGNALTHMVSFCKDSQEKASLKNAAEGDNLKTANTSVKTVFCPIENLVRFIQDTYFETFRNATNFKDACKKSY